MALEDLAHRLASGAIEEGERLAESAAALLAGRGRPHLVGLSVMGATLPAALLIAEELKARWPDVPIVLGGPGKKFIGHVGLGHHITSGQIFLKGTVRKMVMGGLV